MWWVTCRTGPGPPCHKGCVPAQRPATACVVGVKNLRPGKGMAMPVVFSATLFPSAGMPPLTVFWVGFFALGDAPSIVAIKKTLPQTPGHPKSTKKSPRELKKSRDKRALPSPSFVQPGALASLFPFLFCPYPHTEGWACGGFFTPLSLASLTPPFCVGLKKRSLVPFFKRNPKMKKS